MSHQGWSELFDLNSVFRALRYRNYRLFFAGQSVSLIGTWMQQLAVSWLVYRLTDSPLLLGWVVFIGQIPTFLFSSIAGVIADRYDRHKLLVITQIAAMVQAIILTTLFFTNTIAVWHIMLLSFSLGVINAFDIPIRQSFTVEMIERKEDLANAIALNSSMVNMARLIGPSIGGIVIALAGEGACFLFNSISYAAVIFSLYIMDVKPRAVSPVHKDIFNEWKEGIAYAFGFMPIRTVLILLSLVSFMGGAFQVILPIYAKDIFLGGPRTLGVLMGVAGLGAFAGAIYLASRKTVVGLGRVIVLMTCIFGCGLIGVAMCRIFSLSLVLILLTGFGMMVQMASTNTILQTVVRDDMRGRVMSFYTMAFMGMAPMGSLASGSVAHTFGPSVVLIAGGICCLVGGWMFHQKLPEIRKHVRPIYIQKGIITVSK